MSISRFAVALATLAAGEGALALERSFDGSGDALLVPYYSVRDGISTVFSVTNHADAPKAVRVVIAEGRNGRAALSFNVYLAARDSWHGGIVLDEPSDPSARPRLVAIDASCTSAAIPVAGQPLRSDAYSGPNYDHYGLTERDWEGQIEVFDLGTLTGAAAALAEAEDCAGLRARFEGSGPWAQDPNADLAKPAGRLSLEVQFIDVATGGAYDVDTFALSGFSAQTRHGRGVVDFNDVRIYKPTAKNAQGRFDVGNGVEIDGDRPADAVSFLMMAAELEGAFLVQESLDARTRWAISFPTWPAYMDNLPGGEFSGATRPPFHWLDFPEEPECFIDATWQTIDRAGDLGEAKELPLCAQINRIEVLGGDGPGAEAGGFEFYTGDVVAGRLRIGFHPERHKLLHTVGPVPDNAIVGGLPVLAVPMIEVRNANAQPGVLANYAVTGKVVRRRDDSVVDF